MYSVNDDTVYYFVDRINGKTILIGQYDEAIRFLAKKIKYNLSNIKPYDMWDFSGEDRASGFDLLNNNSFCMRYEYLRYPEYVYWKKYCYEGVLKPYMLIDHRGKIVNFKAWEKDIKAVAAFIKPVYRVSKKRDNFVYGEKLSLSSWHKSKDYFTYRNSPVPRTGKRRYLSWSCGGHRSIAKTIRNDEIRNKAKINTCYLWDAWRHTDRSWKTSYKCRKQWMKNLKKGKGIYEG